MNRPTINDVALLAGVSKGTVSRVLNGSPKVSTHARTAVQDAIAETGYRTNALARSLATGRTNAVAVLIAAARSQLFSDPTFSELIEGVHDGLRYTDLNMVILMGGAEAEDRRTLSYIRAGHVDGLLHLNPYVDDPITEGLADSQLPVVLCGPRPPLTLPSRHWMVSIDDAGGVRQALDHLAAQGYRTIATIAGDQRGVSARIRLQTYREWMGAAFSPELVAYGDYGTASGAAGMAALLERRPDIDAVFCASDRMALGALDVARRRGLRVPDDLAVVGFDDHEFSSDTDPPLTTIRQPIRRVGQAGAEVLLASLAGLPASDLVFPTELVIRGST